MTTKNDILYIATSSGKQEPIVDHLLHYRNLFASPDYFIRRKVDYSKMKVFNDKFRMEFEREQTFKNAPILLKNLSEKLAKGGFYYSENYTNKTQVTCIFCKGTIDDWHCNDSPMRKHKAKYPTCPFVISLNVGNVPRNDDSSKNIETPWSWTGEYFSFKIISPLGTWDDDTNIQVLHPLSLDWRKESFVLLEHLSYLAEQGLFIRTEDHGLFLQCCWCKKSVEILDGIETLDEGIFHANGCDRGQSTVTAVVVKDQDFCDVEFSVTTQEIEAQMETAIVHLLRNKRVGQYSLKTETLRSVIERRLKEKGKEFTSVYELLKSAMETCGKQYDEGRAVPRGRMQSPLGALSDYQCVVCLDNAVEIIFLPCGHFKTCAVCSEVMSTCPVCRELIERRVKNMRFK